ncbi:preprotein translocase subunit SecE [Aquaspirillum serpens]|uniref:preprotein translocase subunit SecE n=1 Tax=Aquaspirillum serpens TaxID=190 RepID=UPI0003B37528|nr:preprotein translocase subunit SecE [Aquaspirillum serpens]
MELQDKLKFFAAAALVVAGISVFYFLPETQGVLRVLSVILGVVLAAGLLLTSQPGKNFVIYGQESLAEAKKVVWPTRKEASQLTGLVFLFVVVLAAFMWLVDSGLSWLFYDVILQRG